MNKRQIIASLNNIANELDFSGLYKEASSLTNVMKRLAQEDSPNPTGTSEDFDNVSNILKKLKNTLNGDVEIYSPRMTPPQYAIPEMQRKLNSVLDDHIREYSKYISDDSKPYYLEEAQKLKELAMHRSILNRSLPIEGNFSRLVIPYREDMSVKDLIQEYLEYYFQKAQAISTDPTEIQDLYNEQVERFRQRLIVQNLPEDATKEQKDAVVDEIEALRLKYIKRLSN